MEWNVYEGETEVGVLSAECCGKTLHFRGVFPKITGIHRLYLLLEDGEILPMGVPIPADEGLKLCRSLRRRDAEQLPARLCRAVLCPGDSRPQLPAEPAEKSPEIPAAAPQDRDEKPAVCSLRLDRWLYTAHPETLTEDPVLRRSLAGAPGALYRYRMGCIELALPEAAHAHLVPAITTVRAEEIRGAHCFVLKFGPDGLPQPADEPSTD